MSTPQTGPLTTGPLSPANALVAEGIAAYKAGDRLRARQILTEATQIDPRNETAWLWLAAAHDDPAFRRICLQKVLLINPNNAGAQKGLQAPEGEAARPVETVFTPPKPKPPPATEEIKSLPLTMRARPAPPAERHCPWCQGLLIRLGLDRCPRCDHRLEFDCPNCERRSPLDVEACTHCQYHLGFFSADREAYLARLGDAYLKKGWVDQAVDVYGYLVELAPRQVAYHLRLAQLYGQIEETVPSVNAYKAALDLDPDNLEALTQLARWYVMLHQAPELNDISRHLRQVKRPTTRITLLLGDVEYERQAYASALSIYIQLLEAHRLEAATRARLHYRCGEMYRLAQAKRRALRAYEAALATGASSESMELAQARIDELRPPLPRHAQRSYLETARVMAGLMILVGLMAALQTGLRLERFTTLMAVALGLAVVGSYLAASAQATPLAPEWRALLGKAGLTPPIARWPITAIGSGLLVVALGLILWAG